MVAGGVWWFGICAWAWRFQHLLLLLLKVLLLECILVFLLLVPPVPSSLSLLYLSTDFAADGATAVVANRVTDAGVDAVVVVVEVIVLRLRHILSLALTRSTSFASLEILAWRRLILSQWRWLLTPGGTGVVVNTVVVVVAAVGGWCCCCSRKHCIIFSVLYRSSVDYLVSSDGARCKHWWSCAVSKYHCRQQNGIMFCCRRVPVEVDRGKVFDPIWIKSVMTTHFVPMTMTPDPGVTGVAVLIVVVVVIVVRGWCCCYAGSWLRSLQ